MVIRKVWKIAISVGGIWHFRPCLFPPDYGGDYEYYNNEISRKRSALLIIYTPTNKEIFLQIIPASKVSTVNSLGGPPLCRFLKEAVNGFKLKTD